MSAAEVGAALLWTALFVVLAALIVAFNVGSARTRSGDDQLRIAAFTLFFSAVALAVAGVWFLAAGGVLQ